MTPNPSPFPLSDPALGAGAATAAGLGWTATRAARPAGAADLPAATFDPAAGNAATLTFGQVSTRCLRLTFTANTGW